MITKIRFSKVAQGRKTMKRITLTEKCKNLELQIIHFRNERDKLKIENTNLALKLEDQTLIADTARKLHETLLMQYNLRMDSIINLAKQRVSIDNFIF